MLNCNEIAQYLPNYSSEIIFKALLELSKFDDSIDPDAEYFDEDIIERLGDVLECIEKSIHDTPLEITEAKNYALELIQDKGINIEDKVVEELFRLHIQSGIARAKVFHQVGAAAFNSTLSHLQGEELKQATEQHIKKLHAFNMLINNSEKLDTVLSDYGIASIQTSAKTISVEPEEVFDAEIYRKELLEGNEPKKPTTRHGAQLMLKAMLG